MHESSKVIDEFYRYVHPLFLSLTNQIFLPSLELIGKTDNYLMIYMQSNPSQLSYKLQANINYTFLIIASVCCFPTLYSFKDLRFICIVDRWKSSFKYCPPPVSILGSFDLLTYNFYFQKDIFV